MWRKLEKRGVANEYFRCKRCSCHNGGGRRLPKEPLPPGVDYEKQLENLREGLWEDMEEIRNEISNLPTLESLSPLSVKMGGTGRESLTKGCFLMGNGENEVELKSPDEAKNSMGVFGKPVLVWENSSPQSSFASQSVNINERKSYSWFIVEIKNMANTGLKHTELIPNETGFVSYPFIGGNIQQFSLRRVEIKEEGIFFGIGWYFTQGSGSEVNTNNAAIPTRIWGVK